MWLPEEIVLSSVATISETAASYLCSWECSRDRERSLHPQRVRHNICWKSCQCNKAHEGSYTYVRKHPNTISCGNPLCPAMLYFQQYFYISTKIKKKMRLFQNVLYHSIFWCIVSWPMFSDTYCIMGSLPIQSPRFKGCMCYNFGGGQWRRHFLWICWLLSQTGSRLAGMLSWVC